MMSCSFLDIYLGWASVTRARALTCTKQWYVPVYTRKKANCMQVQNVRIRTDDLVHSKRHIIPLRYKRAHLGDIFCSYKILIHSAGQQRGAVARFSLAQAPGPGPRDGGTARALISPGPRSPRASLSPGPQHACSHARLRTEARPARPARLRDRPLLLAHKSFRLLSTPSGL